MRKVKRFLIRLEQERVWFRNEFRLSGPSKVEDFVVQFEIVEGKKHLTPVRYDVKHKYFHRDIPVLLNITKRFQLLEMLLFNDF